MQIVDETDEPKQFIGPLNRKERRVLGVLIEKSLTTPEYYPLTLKAVATGCNQKSNRDPVTEYDEFELEDVLEELQKKRLVNVVHTSGGRTERYRHQLREVTGWTHAQLAIMAELLLRGRQQVGELRSRASRMGPLDSLDILRKEINFLQEQGYVCASGDLEKRGIEVDHALYTESEQARNPFPAAGSYVPTHQEKSSGECATSGSVSESGNSLADLTDQVESLSRQVQDLEARLETLENLMKG